MASSMTHNSVMGATSTQSRVENAQRLLDRIRSITKKAPEVDKMHTELSFIYDRVRSLENKAMEADRLELANETLRKTLETTQMDARDTERELRQERRQKENLEKKVGTLEKSLSNEKEGSKDLRLQVMEELRRINALEKQIEDVQAYKEKCQDMEKEIKSLRKEAYEQSMIAQHARKCLREEKEKIRNQSQMETRMKFLEGELEVAQSENHTLKKLLGAKQTLLAHQAQVVHSAKRLAHRMSLEWHSDEIKTLCNILDSQPEYTSNGVEEHEENYPRPARAASASPSGQRLFRALLSQTSVNSLSNSTDRIHSPSARHQSTSSFTDFRESANRPKRAWSSEELVKGSKKQSYSIYTKKERARTNSESKTWVNGNQENQKEEEEEDDREYLAKVIQHSVHVGDRCIIDTTPNKAMSAGAHGRAKARKLVFSPATIMYIGPLGSARDPEALYIGVHLEDPVGTSDGTYKGHRYFTTTAKHGKFVPAKKLISVLDKKSGKYRKIESMVEDMKYQATVIHKPVPRRP